jgi:hypothetical protein
MKAPRPMGKPRGYRENRRNGLAEPSRSRTFIAYALRARLMDCHISKINMRALRSPWTELRAGMSLNAVFALGISGKLLNERIWKYQHVHLEPVLARDQLLKLYRDWRQTNPPPVQKSRRPTEGLKCYAGQECCQVSVVEAPEPPPSVERACMCCRQAFISEGKHNRLCKGCNASAY